MVRRANWIGNILGRNCLLRGWIEGQMMKGKGVGKGRRRTTQLFGEWITEDAEKES